MGHVASRYHKWFRACCADVHCRARVFACVLRAYRGKFFQLWIQACIVFSESGGMGGFMGREEKMIEEDPAQVEQQTVAEVVRIPFTAETIC